ncbi:bifunctional hydroxymethylpyrimidine kinase/phosphomethylpyrimidine kinase [Photobacterium sp. SDRW27]|uniref:bifunctional hydroxymethylpyrimidine kinase/phosphomethylpyrimidine kinase n=1 Tax=Photobacterium obscurum TaxID=2829490 RepID=UPI0022445A7B|nr:bifunctional hydroxymethylpyrimidine kinase/phosphomethylpyrimidine kinase [Photobacterium obscurum]MCW8329941.1 bifunctional hydroxymethylpyrimidine kinase/phosphomethylpyrimidine kinase [Photobacterium obscurum]
MAIPSKTPITLTIAGSDSGGGAGIQADIKAISATGGYACSVITALTAQNTQGVSGIFAVDPEFVEQQLDAVFSDLDVKAVKIGMLSDTRIIRAVSSKLRYYQPKFLVVDPVMVATSGDLLLQQDAITTLKTELLPLADVITPNLPEAAALLGTSIPQSEKDMDSMIEALRTIGSKSVLLKGGHLEHDSNSTDLLILAKSVVRMTTPRIATRNTHGTGCTLSAATASFLAQGFDMEAAVQNAKSYITKAISQADELEIGSGHGPVHHFFAGHYQPE